MSSEDQHHVVDNPPEIVVVIDINGVMADVRKKAERKPRKLQPDLFIPSGQAVFIRPHLTEFSNYIRNMQSHPGSNVKFVLWTSRKKVNAEPIEKYFSHNYDLQFVRYFHGEDCDEYDGFHPIKNVRVIRSKMNLNPLTSVIFVDNSPEKIRLDDHSIVVSVHTFDAASYSKTHPDHPGLPDVIARLHSQILAYNMLSSTITIQ